MASRDPIIVSSQSRGLATSPVPCAKKAPTPAQIRAAKEAAAWKAYQAACAAARAAFEEWQRARQ